MRETRGAVLLLGVVLSATAAGCGRGEPTVLRFDGVYRAGPSVAASTTWWRYLRFYADGTVLSASATAEPAQVATWLAKPYEDAGTWSREDDVIRFTCRGPRGAVDHEGEVIENGLELVFHSHINDAEGEATYEFVPLGSGDENM